MEQTVSLELGGRTLTISTGKMAKLAGGSAVVQYGGTVVLVAASAAKVASPNRDFVPLTVDYRERTYAAGKIPGGFFKREGRPTEKEVLSSRLIDRPVRPLFSKQFPYETQIMATVVSADQENDSDVLALIGASAALNLSDIPFPEPIAGVRVGRVDGAFVINPTFEQLDAGDMDMVVAGTADNIIMVEGGTRECSESDLIAALQFAMDHIRQLVAIQRDLVAKSGKAKRALVSPPDTAELKQALDQGYRERLRQAIRIPAKEARQEEVDRTSEDAVAALKERFAALENFIPKLLHDIERDELRRMVLQEKVRADGRGPDDIRPVTVEVGTLPRTHGSCLFTRGETQALAVATLGTKSDEQRVEELEGQSWKSYMLHYNFPPFSVGETRPIRGPGRREIGHGALAERAIEPVIPSDQTFPYTIRLVSDILESNGSSSMASVCGGSMALMDAGVPIKAPVAGIAMGLIKEGSAVEVLTDILGVEDHLGDMDFKVTGTRDGITAFQMDTKIGGISFEVLTDALARARKGRLHILGIMEKALAAPRAEMSPFAPRILILHIHPDKIREVIGPGGKIIKRITEETGAQIDIEDTGEVRIAAVNREGGKKAEELIRNITEDPEVGKVYQGKVRSVVTFGAFVEIVPGRDGLLHISEIDHYRVARTEDVLNLGDLVMVKVIGVDRDGKIKLSRKALLPEPEGGVPAGAGAGSGGGRERDRDRGGRDRDRDRGRRR
ncbi:MAG: polyribonucleotide nucleotidyltransferase [Candidatus Eisenbacteria bacterium]|uniref:Polyribonucleotide nucleotidyltransferase n=1 Tax=Eiseniibacteriota bacterium TaxID=2212470 RepID=A0A9D6L8S7_UNCEI|nr:polyribonucleotide nucleotidyltransferase [Candidatus Eisenbacteria bacterium]MBI3538982.1 polyribonucleotide nucleotidyltransferase [Candidatus Eisenbacteria bacterium]